MTFVEPPPGSPARYGLLEAATVVTGGDPHTLLGVEYQPVCGTAHTTVGACMDPPVIHGEGGDVVVTKTIDDGMAVVDAVGFAVYHLFQCRPVGVDVEARARAAFEQAESMAVEEWFGDYLTAHTAAQDLTPVTGALSPADGLAALEAYAGTTYGGTPVFHGDRGLASLLSATGQLGVNGGRLETSLGGRFAAGGGYVGHLLDPDGLSVTPDDEGWLYVTGPVGFWRGNILNASTGVDLTTQNLIAALANGSDAASNVGTALIERPYMGATSCLIGAVRVTRSICCPDAGLPV